MTMSLHMTVVEVGPKYAVLEAKASDQFMVLSNADDSTMHDGTGKPFVWQAVHTNNEGKVRRARVRIIFESEEHAPLRVGDIITFNSGFGPGRPLFRRGEDVPRD